MCRKINLIHGQNPEFCYLEGKCFKWGFPEVLMKTQMFYFEVPYTWMCLFFCIAAGAASIAVVEGPCDWLTQTLLHCHWSALEPGLISATYSSGGKFKLEHCRIYVDLRKSPFEALDLKLTKSRILAMNQNNFSAHRRHLAFPKFLHDIKNDALLTNT